MPLIETKNFDALIDNKPFFYQPVKKDKKRMKSLLKCQEMMAIQQETYLIFYIIKIIISLVWIYLDKLIGVFCKTLILKEN